MKASSSSTLHAASAGTSRSGSLHPQRPDSSASAAPLSPADGSSSMIPTASQNAS